MRLPKCMSDRIGATAGGLLKGLAVAALAAATLVAPAAAEAPSARETRSAPQGRSQAAPRPAIWVLEDEDTKIYLFGTTHILPPDLRWRSAAVNRMIRDSDELVMETADEDSYDDEAMADWLFMGKSVPILSRVSPPYRERLQAAIDASGLPIEFYDSLHTWAAGFVLMAAMMGTLPEDGSMPDQSMFTGVEDVLTAEFRRARRPISAVETSEGQMMMFRSLPRQAQRAFLESFLQEPEFDEGGLSGDEAWARGNVDFLARESARMPAELYEVLLVRRNRAWTDWLAERLERPGTVLFAVGAAHLAGRDSVQAMLAERGLSARRID